MDLRNIKQFVSSILDGLGVNTALFKLTRRPFIRAFNYHDVPSTGAESFEAQLKYFSQNYVNAGLAEIEELLQDRWSHSKPGIILSFDDGLRSHCDIAAPLLEKYGFTGYFFVPVGLLETPRDLQLDMIRQRNIYPQKDTFPDGRVLMTLEDVLRLDKYHVIGCHTMHHSRLGDALTAEQRSEEIAHAKRALEQILQHEVSAFAWVGGESASYCAESAKAIRDAGFKFSFMTCTDSIRPGCDPYQLQRTNIEADYPLSLVRFQQSGLMDLLYSIKRRRINRLTAGRSVA